MGSDVKQITPNERQSGFPVKADVNSYPSFRNVHEQSYVHSYPLSLQRLYKIINNAVWRERYPQT